MSPSAKVQKKRKANEIDVDFEEDGDLQQVSKKKETSASKYQFIITNLSSFFLQNFNKNANVFNVKIVPTRLHRLELEERSTKYGHLLGCGANEVGQLGFDEDVTEKTRPALIIEDSKAKIVEISAGGMHSLYLTADGEVLSFGCNDEGNKFGIIFFFVSSFT